MNVLITSASSAIAHSLASGLGDEYAVRLTDIQMVDGAPEFALASLGHDASTNYLVRGMDAIVHTADPPSTLDDTAQVDYFTRCTYNLLLAAAEERVARVVLLSTLGLMTAYDANLRVTERWRPRPTAAAPILGKYLCEAVCREFARERKLQVVVLRLGNVATGDETVSAGVDPMWIDMRDVVHAVELALTVPLASPWSVFHIQSASPGARFSIGDAAATLGFAPRYEYVAERNSVGDIT